MTMTERPTIPAALMDVQPIPEAELDLFARLAQVFPGNPIELALEASRRTRAQLEEAQGKLLHDDDGDAEPGAHLALHAPAVTGFRVTDRGLAEWTIRKMAETEAVREERRDLAKQWRTEVDRWERAELAPMNATYRFFEAHLEAFMLAERTASDDKVKSIRLSCGMLKSTGGGKAKPAIEDQAALLAWAEELPEAIRDGELSPIKRSAEVQISRLAPLTTVHELWLDEEGMACPEEEAYSVRRFVTLALNPETGEAWGEDFNPEDHAIPGTKVELPTVKPTVKLGAS